jgi:superfamily II DNA or RNA helicase
VLYELEDVRRSFDAPALKRGEFYSANHRVVNVQADALHGITADVVGPERLPYAVILRVESHDGARAIRAVCSCMQQNCKHAAAVALAAMDLDAALRQAQDDTTVTIDERDPVPVLRLSSVASAPGRKAALVADLSFAYDRTLISPGDPRRELRSADGRTVWPRRTPFERYCMERVRAFGLGYADRERWLTFSSETVPLLRAEGWRVDIDPAFPYRVVAAGDDWSAEVYDTGSPQWFELELGVEVEGKRVSLLPVLIDALKRVGIDMNADPAALARLTTPLLGKLPNGSYVALAPERVARLLATLAGLFGDDGPVRGERARIPTLRAGALADLEGVTMRWTDAQSVRALFDDIAAFAKRPIKMPSTFKGVLRPYQRDGVAWLQALRVHDLGGILADDMGLGKTVQMLAHIAIEHAAKRLHSPVLVVAPTSVVPNWRAEIARFLPRTRVLSLAGPDRAGLFAEIDDAQIVLTSYALLTRDADRLAERNWSIVVLDEAQAIKNPRAKAAIAARRLRAHQRIALSGTPIENHLEELWSIFACAVPGLLPERARFAKVFRTPIESHGDDARRRTLAARVRPFLLRRIKERVAEELPEKTEIVHHVELSGAQRDLYETIRLTMHKHVRDEVERRGLARSRIVVLDALLKLRQVCCDPRLLKLPVAQAVKESQKLDALLEMLETLLEDGRRILLFSQFTSMLDLIKPELTRRDMPFVELRGDTRDRETPVAQFQNHEVPLFLISLRAGGTGLNLTAADTVIHYDPWWNPAVERQATDRAHRIGQQQHVFIYKLIAEHTVEERILELQERKGALAASLFDEAAGEKLDLNLDDLERLFS